ncbi:beta-microseminoprotein A1-like [Cebus imitator]|uniref:beta-microseminoprotein A1-like n=1 Tax=Cebus imitator TaxID=2715852 RepID=UPI0018971AE5|nr:beta-microseminoprotein A1-like [Cebus imitator]
MNVLLGRLVILATFVTLCNASCYLIPNKIVPGESTKDGLPKTGESIQWSDAILEIGLVIPSALALQICKNSGDSEHRQWIRCEGLWFCLNDSIAIPVGYDKDNCQKIFKQEDCKYIVVEKKDPNKTCDVTEWIS